MPITLIPDIHGDSRGLRESLVQAGRAEKTKSGVKITEPGPIIFTGDLCDRGNDNLRVCDITLSIRDQMEKMGQEFTVLMGNHDQFMHSALLSGRSSRTWQWMQGYGFTVLREIAQKKGLTMDLNLSAFPVTVDPRSPVSSDVHREWPQWVKKFRMGRYDFPAAFTEAQEMFLRGEYREVFMMMKVMHEVRRNVWAVHAGINEAAATSGPYTVNHFLDTFRREGYPAPVRDTHLDALMWQRQPASKLTDDTASILLVSKGVDLIIHGHTPERSGHQTLKTNKDVYFLNGDVGICRRFGTGAEFGYINLEDDGSVMAGSTKGDVCMGQIVEDEFIPGNRLHYSI